MNLEETKLTEEELLKKHREERKELQSRVQSMKKTAPKGKKKKELLESILQMEKELDERQQLELEALTTTKQPTHEETPVADAQEEHQDEQEQPERLSRAQRRRNKKSNEDKERDRRIKEQEEENRQGPRMMEIKAIKDILKNEGLQLHNIPADGNCLYCAVNHQLQTTGREAATVNKLRELTATFIRDNKNDFLPFMYNDSDGPVNEEQFEKYCKDVATSKFWGGEMELKALAHVLKCPIKVIQAFGPTTVQGEDFKGPPLVVTYHRHLYRLGEHYNSTVVCVDGHDS